MKIKAIRRRLVSFVLIFTMALTGEAIVNARTVSEIQKDKDKIEDEIEDLDADLYAVVLEIEELSEQITAIEAEIEETKIALEECTVACENQYESMKIRIQYMYEAPKLSMLEMLMASSSVSEFLNRVEYVNDVYEYDREKLEAFEATKAEIEELEAALEQESAELASYKAVQETKKSALNNMISEKKSKLKDIEKELKKAKEKARREAAARAAALAAQRAKSSSKNVSGNLNPSQVTSISGSSVVSYANQFVGGRYVWGGTSLTNGVDCSGFVQQVYAHFGITWSSRMTSGSFRSVGQEVSYDYMQPGDIVCYPGHVGIYAGNGKIVEAQSSATGITNTRSVNCHTIITIRRVI